jgi:hypothetical protein
MSTDMAVLLRVLIAMLSLADNKVDHMIARTSGSAKGSRAFLEQRTRTNS